MLPLISLLLATLNQAAPAPAAVPAKIAPLVGSPRTYIARRGDTLYRIARRLDMSAVALGALNGISGRRVKAGTVLQLPAVHILPAEPPEGIVLNIPERAVYIFRGGRLVARHAVAVGQPDWQTATGSYHLRSKLIDPTWTPPQSMVEREGVKDDPVPPGPENPLGDRWMGWSLPGYGFHSTTSPRSIGRAASHGCVRLYPEWAHAMFEQVRVGMPILSVYRPALLGKREGRYYLSVFEDVYGTGQASPGSVRGMLAAAGLLPLVQKSALSGVLSRRDGAPVPITGEPEPLVVDGKAVTAPVAPVLAADGRWVVPARAVVEGLGGTAAANPGGGVDLSVGGRILAVTPGDSAALLDGQPVALAVPATVVEGTLLVPLRALVDAFGVQMAHERGKPLTLTRATPVTPAAPAVPVVPASPVASPTPH